MPVETILVQGKSDPERGKKRGRIKSDTGKLFQAIPEILDKVVVGQSYDISYKDESFGEATYRVVEGVHPVGGSGRTISHQQRYEDHQPRPVAAPQYVPTTKDEDIATLAIAKEQLSKINPGDVEMGFHVLKSSAMMWRKFKNWQKLGPQTAGEEMDDSIPDL